MERPLAGEELSRWIESLPKQPPESSGTPIVIDGYVLADDGGSVRILPEATCLELSREDVLSCEPLTGGRATASGEAGLARVILRAGATIASTRHGDLAHDAAGQERVPFAFAVRRGSVFNPDASRYRALERRFLDEAGLLE
jgi:hypothetical protein